MQNFKKIYLITLLVAMTIIQGCQSISNSIQEPDIKILGVAINKSFSQPGFTTKLEISNPNGFALNITGVYYELEINGKAIASGTSNKPISLAGYSADTTEFFTSIDIIEGLSLVQSLSKANSGTPNYKIKAKLQLKGIPFPIIINKEGDIDFKVS